MKRHLKLIIYLFLFFITEVPSFANVSHTLVVADDSTKGYDRKLFKHWIDEDSDGCNTRAEVLIEEAIVRPTIGPKCKIIGGKWKSPYDSKTITKSSDLDIDHLIPLAEAWRSGASYWSASRRQAFANDLENRETLVAVSLSLNRGKGDRDIASWIPIKGRCQYVKDWIFVKLKYDLTVDTLEAFALSKFITECGITDVVMKNLDDKSGSLPSQTPAPTQSPTSIPTEPSEISSRSVTPGAFCAPYGSIGTSSSGVTYTCKPSPTDSRNRWRR